VRRRPPCLRRPCKSRGRRGRRGARRARSTADESVSKARTSAACWAMPAVSRPSPHPSSRTRRPEKSASRLNAARCAPSGSSCARTPSAWRRARRNFAPCGGCPRTSSVRGCRRAARSRSARSHAAPGTSRTLLPAAPRQFSPSRGRPRRRSRRPDRAR
jgi:hypothetical protein